VLTCLRISLLCVEGSDGPAKQAEKKCYEGWLESERDKHQAELQHVVMQKKKRLVAEAGCQSDDDGGGGGGGGVAEVGCQLEDDDGGYLRSPSPEREFQQPASNYKGGSYSPLPPAMCAAGRRTQSYDDGRPVSSAGNTPG
jgi:hypothetical protein